MTIFLPRISTVYLIVEPPYIDVITVELAERLRKAVGFRNISVHEYEKVDWEIVFSICTKHMSDFRAYAARVLAFFEIK